MLVETIMDIFHISQADAERFVKAIDDRHVTREWIRENYTSKEVDEARYQAMNDRFEVINDRFEAMNDRFEAMNDRFDSKIGSLEKTMVSVKTFYAVMAGAVSIIMAYITFLIKFA